MKQKLELLAPAGSPEALDAAIGEGADAVYLGLKDFNARLRSTNFTYGQFESALRSLHRMGKKVYVTVNTVFEQREADRMFQFLKYLEEQQPDALIVQDFGIIAMVKAHFPSLRLHASTQMNIASARGANALSRHGISRVVLARELSLEELRKIKTETNTELEVFVHGALCISVSGLCLFSSFLGGKSANRGMCTQACRRLYSKENESGLTTGFASSQTGYYFSPNDLQLLENIPDLATAGVTALKIEGRMKSASYVGAVTSAYRLVVDAVNNNGDEDEINRSIETARGILRNDFARPKTKYFFCNSGNNHAETSNQRFAQHSLNIIDWLNPAQDGGTGISLGTILKVKGAGENRCVLVLPPKDLSLSARDTVRIHKSGDTGRVTQKLSFVKPDSKGTWISANEGEIGDSVYLIQTNESRKRYAPVIKGVASGRGPGREKAPFPEISFKQHISGRKPIKYPFPEGLYVAVSRPDDLYIVQSSRPQKVILTLSEKNVKRLLSHNKTPLPFKPKDIILVLDSWFPPEQLNLTEQLEKLIEMGYTQFVLNNMGHFSLFRDYSNVKLIAGTWLYTFNSWSLSFISSLGADAFVTPLENNRQNLERTLGVKSKENKINSQNFEQSRKKKHFNHNAALLHSKCFVTVFCWPPLFKIKADLAPLNIKTFNDNLDEMFSLDTSPEGSTVYPKKYFSIIDKIPFLQEAGFKRFIIDLNGNPLKKNNYRDLMKAVTEHRPLPNSNRFNWKDGFYSPDISRINKV